MIKTITIELTDAQHFALSTVALDPLEWVEAVVSERARVAKEALKGAPEWAEAALAIETLDDWQILLHGRDMGVFKSAMVVEAHNQAALLQHQADREAEQQEADARKSAEFDERVAEAVAAALQEKSGAGGTSVP